MDKGWYIQRTVVVSGEETAVNVVLVDSLEYHGEWMGEEYVTVNVKSPEPIDFQFGDYLTYRGENYILGTDPNVVKKSRRGTYREGFTYDNIKLYAVSHEIKNTDFKDVVLNPDSNANTLVYTSLTEFQFFAGSVEDLADRLQANLDRRGFGFKILTPNWLRCQQRGITQEEWEAIYDDPEVYGSWGIGNPVTLGETDINISVTKDDGCWEMLGKAYSEFGLSFYTNGLLVVIGAPPVRPGNIFRYGKDNGLYEVERTSEEDQQVVTKVWGYGSDQNLPLNYYANVGNKVKYVVTEKRTRHDIGDKTTYEIYLDITWKDSLRTGVGFTPTVFFGDHVAAFHFGGSSYIGALFYWIVDDGTENEETQLYDAVSVGDTIYSTADNFNNIPEENIEHLNNYPALLSINRLMLPGFPLMSLNDWLAACAADSGEDRKQWGGLTVAEATQLLANYIFSDNEQDPWVQSPNAAITGVLEGSVFFDSSGLKEIMPTINNTNAGKVAVGSVILDNGWLPDDMSENDSRKIFTLKVLKSSLDWLNAWNTRDGNADVVLSMTSGNCAGREFKLKSAPVEGTGNESAWWILTLWRTQDENGRWWPYQEPSLTSFANIQTDDTFAVTGIRLPDEYVVAASVKLLLATCGWLDRRDHVRYTYVPKVDEVCMARQDEFAHDNSIDSLHDILKAGMQMQLEDSDLGIARYGEVSPYIDQLTIHETGGPVPTYDVVLRDEKEKGFKEQIAESIAQLKETNTSVTERQTQSVQIVDRGAWEQGGVYYYETVNIDTGVLETSQVSHLGLLWLCLRSGTREEPQYGAQDWKTVDDVALKVKVWNKKSYDLLFQDEVDDDIAEGENYTMSFRVYFGEQDITSLGEWAYNLIRDDGNTGFSTAYYGVLNNVILPFEAFMGGMVTVDGVTYDMRRMSRVGVHNVEVIASVATVSVTLYNPPSGYDVESGLLTLKREFAKIETLDEWVEGGDYHNNPRVVTQVWHNGMLWQCLVEGATDEPSEESDEWQVISGATGPIIDAVIGEVEDLLNNYNVSFSDYVDVITVDDIGNVIGGLWTEGANGEIAYRIHSAITVRNNNRILTIADDDEDAGAGTYKIHAEPHDCTCELNNSTICITSISNIKDGVAGTEDDEDFDYDAMREMESCWVDFVIDCEGNASITKRFPVRIKHDPLPFVALNLSNQMSAVSWNSFTGSYTGLPISIIASMWHNSEMLDIASTSDVSVSLSVPGASASEIASYMSGITIIKSLVTEDGHKKALIRVTALPESLPLVSELEITCVAVYSGVRYERTVGHVINKSNDVNVYQLKPSYTSIEGHYDNSGVLVLSHNKLYCSVVCSSSNDNSNYDVPFNLLSSLNLQIKYVIETASGSGTETSYSNTNGVDLTVSMRKVTFKLYEVENGVVVHTHDIQDVPIICDGAEGLPGTLTQRRYRSLNTSTYPYAAPTTEDNPTGWGDVNVPSQVTTSNRYRWMIERYSTDGGDTWNNWSTPVIDFYLAEDGTSISITGSVVAVEDDENDLPATANENDLAICTDPTGTWGLTYGINQLACWVVGAWEDSGPIAQEGDCYLNSVDGHLWQYKNSTWNDLGQIKGDKGDKGDDAVVYEIQVIQSSINVNPNGSFTGGLTWKVLKREGATTTQIASSGSGTHCWRIVGDNWQGPYHTVTSNPLSIGNELDNKNWKTYISSTYNRGTGIQLAYFDSNNNELATLTVPFTIQGQMSRNLYYANEWTSGQTFEATDYKAPYYAYTVNGVLKYWAFVGDNGTYSTTSGDVNYAGTPGISDNWREMTDEFSYLITQAIFSQFAKLGSAVFNGDYMFSQHGYMLGYNRERTDVDGESYYSLVNPLDILGDKWDDYSGSILEDIQSGIFPFTSSDASDWTDFENSITGSAYSCNLVSGKYYSIRVGGEGVFSWKLSLVVNSVERIVAQGVFNAPYSNPQRPSDDITYQAVNFYCEHSGNYTFYVKTSSTSDCYVEQRYVSPCQFVPFVVFDWRLGNGAMEQMQIRGGFIRGMVNITPSNYTDYLYQSNNGENSGVSFLKICGNISISSSWTKSIAISFNTTSKDGYEKMLGLSGQSFTIVNNSSYTVILFGHFYRYYSDANYGETPMYTFKSLPAGKTAIVTCDCRLSESRSGSTITYGALEILLRLRIEGATETV